MTDIRVCFIGDSFVNGTLDATYLGWTGRLCVDLAQGGLAVTSYNLGVRRDTSIDIARRWQGEARVRFADGCDNRLVFSFGTNDTAWEGQQRRVALSESINSARRILDDAQQYPALMVGPPPIADAAHNQRTQELSDQFATLCAQLQVPYLDIFTPLRQSTRWRQAVGQGDGAHPVAAGYEAIAQLVKQWPTWQQWFL